MDELIFYKIIARRDIFVFCFLRIMGMEVTEYEKEQIRKEVERIISEFVLGGIIGIICFCIVMVFIWQFYGFLG